jgi:hypothetical protein
LWRAADDDILSDLAPAINPQKQALERHTQELQAKLQVPEQAEQIGQRLEEPDKKKPEVAARRLLP